MDNTAKWNMMRYTFLKYLGKKNYIYIAYTANYIWINLGTYPSIYVIENEITKESILNPLIIQITSEWSSCKPNSFTAMLCVDHWSIMSSFGWFTSHTVGLI